MIYALRSVLLRFCVASLFCALAVSVNAMVVTVSNGNGVIPWVPLNDCSGNGQNIHITGHCTVYSTNGTVLSSLPLSYIGTSSPNGFSTDQGIEHGYGVETIGTTLSQISEIQMSVQIGPYNGDNAASETYVDDWFNAMSLTPTCGEPGNFKTGPYAYYSHYGSQSCSVPQAAGCFPNNDINAVPLSYTNLTATPQEVSWNGNTAILQPGQSTNFMLQWPAGTTGNFNVANQSPDDGSFNNPQFQNTGQVSNIMNWNGSQWTNLLIDGVTNFTLPPGPDGGLLSTGQGSIVWSNAVNATPANNGTLQAGFQLLNNDMLANQAAANNDWSNFLSQLHNTNNPIAVSGNNNGASSNNPAGGTASNVWVMNWPSNLFNTASNNFEQATQVWVQNWPTNINTNTALGMVWANTNQAGAIVSGASAQVGSLDGMVPNTLADNSGGAEEQDIRITPATAQQQVTIAMGVLPASLSTTFSQIRGVIAWFVCILLAIWNFVSLFRTIKDVSQVPQAQGPDTGAWAAVGANVLTAIVVASAVVAVISVLPVFAVGILAGELTFASSYSSSSPLNFFNSMGWGFQFLSQYLPIYLMFTAFGVRVVYYFGLEVLAFFACIVIKLLIGV
jgi:hypothetical protein